MADAVSLQGKQQGAMSTLSLLLLFLLSITSFAFGSLYFEAQHKVKLLSAEVKQLQSSQVLLMVADEQAEVVAKWMQNNPHFVQPAIDKAKQGGSQALAIGPGGTERPPIIPNTVSKAQVGDNPKVAPVPVKAIAREADVVENHKKRPLKEKPVNQVPVRPKSAVTLEETDDGVKLISLPHGGVRVTTRDP